MNFFQKVGASTIAKIKELGHFFLFIFNAIKCVLTPRWYSEAILKQMLEIGFYSFLRYTCL